MKPIEDILSDLLALDEILTGSRSRTIPHISTFAAPVSGDKDGGASHLAGDGPTAPGETGRGMEIGPSGHPWRNDPVGWTYYVVIGRELSSAQRARWTATYERHHSQQDIHYSLQALARDLVYDSKLFGQIDVAALLSSVAKTPPAQWREAGPFATFVAAYFLLNSRLPSIDEAERYLHGLLQAPQAPLGIARTVAEATSGIGKAFDDIERQLLAARPWPGFGRSSSILKPFAQVAIAHDTLFVQKIIGKEMQAFVSMIMRLLQKSFDA